jgi:spore morphogenesis protein SipL
MRCQCVGNGTIDIIGLCDPDNIDFTVDTSRNTTEISIPEILTIPCEKPCIETIDKVFVDVKIISKRVIKTPAPDPVTTPNKEGTLLTNRKLIVEGLLLQKIVYTADLPQQSVHSAHFEIPFSAFIVLPTDTDLDAIFCIEPCVEDVFVKQINCKQIFKNVTLFLRAVPLKTCS